MSISLIKKSFVDNFNFMFKILKKHVTDLDYSLISQLNKDNEKLSFNHIVDIGSGIKLVSCNIYKETLLVSCSLYKEKFPQEDTLNFLKSLLIDENGKEVQEKYDVHIILDNVEVSKKGVLTYIDECDRKLDRNFYFIISPKDSLDLGEGTYKFSVENIINTIDKLCVLAKESIDELPILSLELFIFFLFYFKNGEKRDSMMFFGDNENSRFHYMSIMTNEQYGNYVIRQNKASVCDVFTFQMNISLSMYEDMITFEDFVICKTPNEKYHYLCMKM